ncbi:MAG: hypothetical protein IJ702_09330, partial [Fretibacterium sp.]|nr:hypothetical protein [Fretibacterium sp.]
MRRLALLAAALCLLTLQAEAATYYVRKDTGDMGIRWSTESWTAAGTEDTLESFLENTVTTGDVVYVAGGPYKLPGS